MPRVSVIVTTYNRPRELERALNSIAVQTFRDFDIFIVNDGGEWPRAYSPTVTSDHSVRVIHRNNGGPAAARNTGLAASDSEYIAYLDDDDEWRPNHLETHLSILSELPKFQMVFGVANVVYKGVHHRFWGNCHFNKFILDSFHTIFPMSVCLHRRRVLDKSGVFDENPLLIGPEDCEFVIRVSDFQSPIPSRVCTVTMHRDRSMTREPREQWSGVLKYVIEKLGYGSERQNWLMFYRAYVAAMNEGKPDLAKQWSNQLDNQLPAGYKRFGTFIRGTQHLRPDGIKAFCRAALEDEKT